MRWSPRGARIPEGPPRGPEYALVVGAKVWLDTMSAGLLTARITRIHPPPDIGPLLVDVRLTGDLGGTAFNHHRDQTGWPLISVIPRDDQLLHRIGRKCYVRPYVWSDAAIPKPEQTS